MPVHAARVSLDTAKTWAKRLAKTSRTTDPTHPWPLARCQLAVATMLGYDHWHALNQALAGEGRPTEPDPSTKPLTSPGELYARDLRKLQALTPPTTLDGWPAFWRELLDIEGGGGEAASLRLRVNGQLLFMGDMDSQNAIKGVLPMLSGEMQEQLRRGLAKDHEQPISGSSYLKGELDLPNDQGDRPRWTGLPVYPRGMDLVIRAKPSAQPNIGLEHLQLPQDVMLALRKACSFSAGAFFFTGSARSGRSTLMDLVVRDRVKDRVGRADQRLPPEYKIPRGATIPVIQKSHIKGGTTRAARTTSKSAAMCGDPDVLVFGEVRDQFTEEGIFKAAKSGIAAFSTCHGAQSGLPDRLIDLGISDKDCEQHLRGWAYTNLLPVLCPHCSTPFKTIHGLRTKGHGCDKCSGLGVVGRQLIVDLWQVEGGARKQLFSCMDQARDLVRKGRVDYNTVYELMGPLGL